MSYGKCQRCDALGQLEPVGTLVPESMKPVVLQLCRACAPKYLHLNRRQRRGVQQTVQRFVRHGGKPKVKQVRPRDDAKRIRPKKPSPILLPSEPQKPEHPTEKRSKGGIILP